MADKDKKDDEVVEETEETTEEETTEEEKATEEEEVSEVMTDFDKKIDGEDDDSTDDDDGEEEVAEEDPAAEEDATEKATDEDDGINAAADALEKEAEAESKKSVEQKATEKAAADKVLADEAKAEEDAKEEPYDCGLSTDEDGYEPALVETLNKQGQATLDRAVKAEKANAKLVERLDRQDAQREADWLDKKFGGLGENFAEALGIGDFDDLEVGSDQRANRMAISKRMSVTIKAFGNSGKPMPTLNKLFDMAVAKLHSKETKQPEADKETIKKGAKRSKQALGSGGKKASTVSAAKRAEQVQKDFDAKIDSD